MALGKFGALAAAALIAATAPTAASAALVTFTFTGDTPTYGTAGNVYNFSAGGVTGTVSAWSRSTSGVTAAYLGVYAQGLGITNGSNDNSHMIDNQGNYDFLVFKFDQVVEAEKATFYDFGDDSDAWIGVGNSNSVNITNWASVQSLFGTFEANGNTGSSQSETRNINSANEQGNLLFISASMDSSDRDDDFKLKNLTINTIAPPAVPEPTTWAMMIAGFGLVGGAMRRRNDRLVHA